MVLKWRRVVTVILIIIPITKLYMPILKYDKKRIANVFKIIPVISLVTNSFERLIPWRVAARGGWR